MERKEDNEDDLHDLESIMENLDDSSNTDQIENDPIRATPTKMKAYNSSLSKENDDLFNLSKIAISDLVEKDKHNLFSADSSLEINDIIGLLSKEQPN